MPERRIAFGPVGETVGRNVIRIREGQRLSYAELARRIRGVGRPIQVLGLSRIERGQRRVDVDDLVALATVLGVRPEALLQPWNCSVCNGTPPVGFVCATCGAESPNA